MSRSGFHTITLGCKLNQFDSAGIEAELLRRGLRREDDPNKIVLLFGTADVERVKEFIDSDTLRNAMKAAGVIGEPRILFLNESW